MVNNSEYTHSQKRLFQMILDTQQAFESLDERPLKIYLERLTWTRTRPAWSTSGSAAPSTYYYARTCTGHHSPRTPCLCRLCDRADTCRTPAGRRHALFEYLFGLRREIIGKNYRFRQIKCKIQNSITWITTITTNTFRHSVAHTDRK